MTEEKVKPFALVDSYISYEACPVCERILHIIDRFEQDGKPTCVADIQEVIRGERSNEGRRHSLDHHIEELEDEGYIFKFKIQNEYDRRKIRNQEREELLVPVKNKMDKRRVYLRLNYEEIHNISRIRTKNDFWTNPSPKVREIECKICNNLNKAEQEFGIVRDKKGRIKDYWKISYHCKNCGFVFYYTVVH